MLSSNSICPVRFRLPMQEYSATVIQAPMENGRFDKYISKVSANMRQSSTQMSDILRNIKSVTDYHKEKERPIILANFDQEKALDRVPNTYMVKILRKFNFGTKIIVLIEKLYNDVTSNIEINGHLTTDNPFMMGLRQGCPLSMCLYTITAEPLMLRILENDKIKGCNIAQHTMNTQQYADDLTITSTDFDAIEETYSEFKLLKKATGQRLNKKKTQILCIGEATDHIHEKAISEKTVGT